MKNLIPAHQQLSVQLCLLMFSSTEDITSHRSSSSSSTSDREDSEAETDTDRPKESNHEEPDVPEERAQPNPEETSEAELKDTEVENSAADGTEIHIPDSTGPSGTENELSADTSGDTDESKQEEELERGEWKSAITRTSS